MPDQGQPSRILVAKLTGEAMARSGYEPRPDEDRREAVEALRELAAGRTDLLAEVAGILEGAGRSEPDAARRMIAAGLCREAGADPEAVAGWVEEGERRAALARQPPMSGGIGPHASYLKPEGC